MDQRATDRQSRPARWRRAIAAVALLAVGILIGSATTPTQTAWGEVQTQPDANMFKSGSQVSVPILRDIAATLHQMDARLARLETLARQMQTRSN